MSLSRKRTQVNAKHALVAVAGSAAAVGIAGDAAVAR